MTNPTPALINRMDAIQACQVGPSDEWSKSTKSGYAQAATDCARNILRIEPATPTPDPNAGAVKVKPLVWRETGTDRFSAKGEDYKVVTDGTGWAFCPEDWPPFGGYPYETLDEAKAAAQADYAARILSAIETTPDPRDEVIARLMEASDALRTKHEYMMRGRAWSMTHMQIVCQFDAALAAAKEVMK